MRRSRAATPVVWKNWTGDQRCAPAEIVRPTSEDELAQVVADAAARGLRVRAVGSGHSFTDIACTDGAAGRHLGAAARDRRRSRVRPGDRPGGDHAARARAGELRAHGLALENQGDIDTQALAGALATATHGTGVALRQPLDARGRRCGW